MNYLEFREKIRPFPLFDTNNLAVMIGEKSNRAFLNNLANWEKAGYLIKLKKGLYFPHDLASKTNPIVLATKIYQPSYVSLETALSYYGIIPEAVFTTTSVTTRKTKSFVNKEFGKFSYQKIKRTSFGGFRTFNENNISYNIALPEKALVDFFYLNRNILDGTKEQFNSYRFNEDYKYKKRELLQFAKRFENKKVLLLIDKFIEYYVAK